ncbi:MAG: hypothetical protein IJS14_06210 [Lentisphaeria bacterium]|nr:hypothetical protein [Lentisphaeria bacterium]
MNRTDQELLSGKLFPRLFLAIAFVIPLLWMAVVRMQGMKDGETANDTYYHIAMAEQGPAVFCARKFPALQLSVWRETFADKELLYHFLLSGLVKVQQFAGGIIRAPFHFPALVFTALLLAALLFAMKRMGVPPPLYLPMTMLAMMSAPNVLFRMLMLRPHILSLILMLILCAVLSGGSLRRRLIWTAVISMVYAWSYSNPQFIVIPVLFFAAAGIREDGRKSLWLPAVSLAGVLLGLLIHPQFPNSFIIWKVQSFDALFGPLLAGGARQYGTLMPPMEMMAPGVIWNRNALPLYIFVYLNFLVFARLIARLGWKRIPSCFYAVGGLSLLFTGGTFLVLRTVEYAGPFAGLFGAMVWGMALREDVFLPGRDEPRRFCLILTLAVMLPALLASAVNISYSKNVTPRPAGIGPWMEQNLPEKTLVVNLSWGDFPSLYYASRKMVYLWGMDPEFSVAADPVRTRRIEQTFLDSAELTPRRFYAVTGAKYAVLLAKREKFVQYLKALGWRPLYEAGDGAVLSFD